MSRSDRNGRTGRKPVLYIVGLLIVAVALFGAYRLWFADGGREAQPGGKPGQTAQGGSGSGAAAENGGAGEGGGTNTADGTDGGTGGEGAPGEGVSGEGADKPGDGDEGPAAPDRNPALIGYTPDGEEIDPDKDVTQADLDRTYDIVIAGGRVINPETYLDRSGLNVGISGGTIGVVTSKPLKGKRVIDAKGLVVAPGFIDNLSYDPNPLGVWNKIADGVTSNIAMHGGTTNPEIWYDHYTRDKPPVHFGASFFAMNARNQFKLSRYDSATPEQIAKLKRQAEEALNEGALGISFSLEYAPGTDANEVLALMEVAQRYNVPVYFHGRYSDDQAPGTEQEAMDELIGYAKKSGAAVHVDHINSTGGTFSMQEALAKIDEARALGYDITADTYAYDYWGTYLNSARFDPGWQERFHIGYNDLQIAGTSERLTAETFVKYQKQGKLAVAYAIPAKAVDDAFRASYVMIGSDAILEPGHNNHPRASGNFARAVGLYVRERNVMSLMDAMAKLSLLPAQRLEKQAPALRKKGRLAKGMDADIVVFDYNTINDASTVERPDLPSKGIAYVLVSGRLALEDGKVNKKVRPGQPIRSRFERVTESAGVLQWDGASYPLLAYPGAQTPYVDLAALAKHGYGISWDQVTRTYTLTEGGNGNGGLAGDPAAEPARGELVLERGYRVSAGDRTAELLSVGTRAYVPLSFLQDLGVKAENDGDVWTAGG